MTHDLTNRPDLVITCDSDDGDWITVSDRYPGVCKDDVLVLRDGERQVHYVVTSIVYGRLTGYPDIFSAECERVAGPEAN